LLRLLAVKKLLADHWSVIKIREFMRSLDTRALEQIITDAIEQAGKDVPPHPFANHAVEESNVTDFNRTGRPPLETMFGANPPALASIAVASARRAGRGQAAWVEVAPGLEIRIRRGFRQPQSSIETEKIIARIRKLILAEGWK
jgi:hypothetical protein